MNEFFEVKKTAFYSGYFIFTFCKNMVSNFHLEELPEWEFGIWLNNNNRGFRIFGEHKLLIDKFKPSHTYLSKSLKDISQLEKSFIPSVQSIINKPYLHFDKSLHFGKRSNQDPKKVYEDFIRKEDEKEALELASFLNMKKKIKEVLNNPLIDDIQIKDRNTKNSTCSPRYDIEITLKDIYNEELKDTYQAVKDEIEAEYDSCRATIYWYE